MAENLETNEATEVAAEETTEKKGKFYSDEEIELLKQKEGDRRISQYQKTVERKNKEAVKLSKMTDDEKFQYELDERERAIEEKERALILAENKNAVAKILSEKGLSLAFVDFCVDEDAEVMDKKIKTIEKEFRKCVKAEVESRLSSNSPKKAINADEGITLDQFKKMSLAQQSQLYHEAPEIYNSLVEQLKK